MTISTLTRRAGPTAGNGATTVFSFGFKIFAASDLQVVATTSGVETVQTLTTHYSVTLNANQNSNPGGTVTMVTPPATGTSITIVSAVTYTQPTDFGNLAGFYPVTHSNSFDRATIQIQQLRDQISRAIMLPASSASGVSTQLPAPAPDQLIGWNPAGTGLKNYPIAGMSISGSSDVATYVELTALAAADRSNNQRVYVAGRAAVGDGADGWWYFVAASTATPDGGTVLRPDDVSGGDPGRWLRLGAFYIDPLWFGVLGNDSFDNAATLAATFTAANGRAIIFPAGNFRTSVKHSLSGVDVAILGAGPNITNIIYTGSTNATTGLDITVTNDEQFVHITGIALKTTTTTTLDPAVGLGAAFLTGKVALKIDGTAQISGGGDPVANANVLQNRSEKRVSISNFSMTGVGDSLSTGWDVGMHFKSIGWVAVNDWVFLGRFNPPNWVGAAVIVSGLGVPTEFVFSDFRIYSARIGFVFPDYSEGVYMSDFDMVNVTVGINAIYVSGLSEVASQSYAGLLQPNIGPGHINCRVTAISLNNTNQGTLNDLNLYVTPIVSDGGCTALSINGGALNAISAVRISYLDGGTHTGDQNACVLTNVNQSSVVGLMVSAADDAGLILTGGTHSRANSITGAIFSSCGTGIVYDTNASGNVEVGTVFDNVTTPRALTNGNNVIYRKTFAESPVFTLTGGAATEVVDVPIPTGYFSAKPQSGFLTGTDSDQYVGFYDWNSASSTATNARFLIARAQGGNVNAGLRRFSVSLSE